MVCPSLGFGDSEPHPFRRRRAARRHAPRPSRPRLAGSGTWFASGSGTPLSSVKARRLGMLLTPLVELAKTEPLLERTPPVDVYFSIVLLPPLAK